MKVSKFDIVSILARAEARALHWDGCTLYMADAVSILARAEARALRETPVCEASFRAVSILARAEARALHCCIDQLSRVFACFNPRPRRGAGATGG